MAHKTLVNGTAYEISGGRTLVGGTGYDIEKGRTLVGGTGYDIPFTLTIGDLPVGTTVYAKINGTRTAFLVVHHGNPNTSIYDGSCNGTWLVMKDAYINGKEFGSVNNYYEHSGCISKTYLNPTFYNLIDSVTKSVIKTVKIPWVNSTQGSSTGITNMWGANGSQVQVFLLSARECGFKYFTDGAGVSNKLTLANDGATLSYFTTAANRVCYKGSTAVDWFTRTPGYWEANYSILIARVRPAGTLGNISVTSTTPYVRPAFIVYPETIIDDNYNIVGL